MASKATDYKRQFNAEKYDRIEITVPKGQKKVLQSYCKDHNTSVNKLIRDYINTLIGGTIHSDTPNENQETL